MAKVKLTKEEIKELNKEAWKVIEATDFKLGRKSQNEEFLMDIKEIVKGAIDKPLPFTNIVKIIKDIYSIDVSVNVLKQFAKKHCGYVPTPRLGGNKVVQKIAQTQKELEEKNVSTSVAEKNEVDKKVSNIPETKTAGGIAPVERKTTNFNDI
jgi:hypothetical protein